MSTEQKYFNEEAARVGKLLGNNDRKILAENFNVSQSYIRHLFSGTRKAQRGKAIQIFEVGKRLAELNNLKQNII